MAQNITLPSGAPVKSCWQVKYVIREPGFAGWLHAALYWSVVQAVAGSPPTWVQTQLAGKGNARLSL
jgi:hypothetical protein